MDKLVKSITYHEALRLIDNVHNQCTYGYITEEECNKRVEAIKQAHSDTLKKKGDK